MNNNILKITIFSVVGGFVVFLLLGGGGRGNSSVDSLRQLAAQNAESVRRVEVLLAGVKGELKVQADRSAAFEKRLDQVQAKLEQLSKVQGVAEAQVRGEDYTKVYSIAVGASPIKGAKNAPVTIVMFADLQCPFCARFYPPVVDVLKAYPKQVNFVMKNFPLGFHPNAMPAAKLALAASEQGKYFEMVELLLANKAEVNEAKIKEYAKSLRMNARKLADSYKNKDAQWTKQISDDMQLAKDSDVRGTPTFYINGRKTRARDLAAFKVEIDALLK